MQPDAVDGKHDGNNHLTKARIISKHQSHEQVRREMIIPYQQRSCRNRKDWTTLPTSTHAANTINPIRRIVDAVSVAPNPDKSLIKLHLGDPTLTGALPPSQVAVDALVEAVKSHKNDGYGPAVGTQAAREAVATRYTHPEAPITADDVILASGCSHALQMAIEGIANPGDNILIPQPGFPLYSTLCRPHGIEEESVFCLPGSAFSAPGWIRLVITHTEEITEDAASRIRLFCERCLINADLVDVGESSDEGCDISNSESF
ncbi:hypothetical protein NECAME_12417 [Necator americanus]|uniref:Aminotransferase class I/classII large domain-containing protein n=1 Tax=Necator americanus TaxID=51031 RepID=W2T0F0_NECAM|nr:hypothetical protein NECAME_12417 [Necator americanus]ETN75363.1 hypothetical protein NECAME_12417 [Necator americanus]